MCNARDAGVYLLNQEEYGLDPGKTLIRPAPIAASLWNQNSASVLFVGSLYKNIRNYSGSMFKGSRLPWHDLICILETIALDSTPGVSTQRERKARSGPGVQG